MGLADIARHVTGCPFAQDTRVQYECRRRGEQYLPGLRDTSALLATSSKPVLNPGVLSFKASFDVTSNIWQALIAADSVTTAYSTSDMLDSEAGTDG